jgi:hypothetical protein
VLRASLPATASPCLQMLIFSPIAEVFILAVLDAQTGIAGAE